MDDACERGRAGDLNGLGARDPIHRFRPAVRGRYGCQLILRAASPPRRSRRQGRVLPFSASSTICLGTCNPGSRGRRTSTYRERDEAGFEPPPFRFPAFPPPEEPRHRPAHRMEDLKKWYRAGLATRIEALKAARRELDAAASRLNPCAASRTPCGVREPPTAFRKNNRDRRRPGKTPPPKPFPKALEKLLDTSQGNLSPSPRCRTMPASSSSTTIPTSADLLRTVLNPRPGKS